MTGSTGQVAEVKKIAVLRANAIGDFILSLPALEALQTAYPEAKIVFLGRPWHHHFLAGRPGPIDRVISVPPARGVSKPDTWREPTLDDQEMLEHFFFAMQAEHFDLALQMHGGGGYSNPFLLQLGARTTAGMKSPAAPPLDRWIPYFYWQHEIMRLLEVVRLVGAVPSSVEPHLTVTSDDLRESYQFVPAEANPFVVLHPGASDPRRRWPAENFASVGDALTRLGLDVYIVGVDEEKDITLKVQEGMRSPAMNLSGRLSLSGLAGLLARARLVIANDSGPRHLAEAVGTPTVGIFWCGNLINAGPAFRTYHRPHLSWQLNCPICGQHTIHNPCEHRVSFVDQVRVEEILDSAQDVLALVKAKMDPTQAVPIEDRK